MISFFKLVLFIPREYSQKQIHSLSVIHSENLKTPYIIFQHYHPGYFHVVCIAKSSSLFIFGCILKPGSIEGGFKTEKLDLFFILVNEFSFATNFWVFKIIKILSKSSEGRNLGQSIVLI